MQKKLTLKEMRELSNLSITEAASLAKVSYPSLINWENGKSVPNILSIQNMLSVYKQDFDALDTQPFKELEQAKKYKTAKTN